MTRHKLDVRRLGNDLFFYIDGSLQFSTADEHLYHEPLVAPAAFLSKARSRKPIDALILGGGDGLALRELLRLNPLNEVTLVDYDEAVVELAKTAFAPWNKNSLADRRVAIKIKDARDYLASTKRTFDLIIADFTFPASLTECELFTSKFFSLVNQRLSSRGIFALNAVSPSSSCAAYWSIFRTLLELKIYPKPLHISIPSFTSHGYGDWGFFFASRIPVSRREINDIKLPEGLKFLNRQTLLESMKFPYSAVELGLSASKALREPSDLLVLLNVSELWPVSNSTIADFSYSLSRLRLQSGLSIHYNALMSEMAAEWEGRIISIFKFLDWDTFLDEAEKRFKDMPKKFYDEFKQLRSNLSDFLSEKVFNLERAYQCFAVLMILMIFINLMYPDNSFAKGYHGSHGTGDGSTQIALVAPVAADPFHGFTFQTANLSASVPDMRGKAHARKTTRFNVSLAGNFTIDETLFYAVSDDIVLTESGQPYFIFEGKPYAFRVEPQRFMLVECDTTYPLFEFYPDAETMQILKNNLVLQMQAVERAVVDYSKWLTWAGPAKYFNKDISVEIAELKNVKSIQAALSRAYKNFSDYTSSSDIPPAPTPFKLAPSVYLTTEGSIVFRQADGNLVSYPYQSFAPSSKFTAIAPNEKMDGFVKTLLKTTLLRLPKSNAMRAIIEERMPSDELPRR